MRPKTQRKIDALHAQIAKLITLEKLYHDSTHLGENKLWNHVAHTRIGRARFSPGDREQMRYAVAALRGTV